MSKFRSIGSQDAPGSHFSESLRLRLSEDLHLTGKAKRTHDGYVRAVRQLSDFAGCSPEQVNEQHVRQFFLHLKNDRNFAYGSLRVAFSGIKFFFTHTCKRDWEIFKMLKLQNITTLPEVLTIEQVHELTGSTTTRRMFVYFWTVYSLGLRLNEALHLQVSDIDAERGWVHVHRGKGAKDRYVPLPTTTVRLLRNYWASHRHPCLLFPADGLYGQVDRETWSKDFVVDIQPVGHGVPTLKYLAPYVHRVAINDSRIIDINPETVTYRVRRKGNVMQNKTVAGEDFVGNFLQHVLPTNFMKIRHYGWMSGNSKVKAEEVKWLVWLMLGWTFWLGSGYAPQTEPLTVPMKCRLCGGIMRVIEVSYTSLSSQGIRPEHGLTYYDSG